MSFQDFQRQIEIVSDPAVVEQWKEQARSITTYTTKGSEPAVTFNSLGGSGAAFPPDASADLAATAPGDDDRRRGQPCAAGSRAWARDRRRLGGGDSLALEDDAGTGRRLAAARGSISSVIAAGCFTFRRSGRASSATIARACRHGECGFSTSWPSRRPSIASSCSRSSRRKALNRPRSSRVKMTLASDLRWLISEGYVIEFNDGSLDLPRAKAPAPIACGTERAAEGASACAVPGTESSMGRGALTASASSSRAEMPARRPPYSRNRRG